MDFRGWFLNWLVKLVDNCYCLCIGDSLKDEQSLPRNAQLPYDTVAIFLRHLQDSMTHLNIGFETITTIMRYIKNQSAVAARPSPPPNILQRTTTSPPPSATLHSVAEASPLRIATSEALNPTFSRSFKLTRIFRVNLSLQESITIKCRFYFVKFSLLEESVFELSLQFTGFFIKFVPQ